MGAGTWAHLASLWQRENGGKKSISARPIRPSRQTVAGWTTGSRVCWCWWGRRAAIGPLPGSQHDKPRAFARANCTCNRHSLDSQSVMEAEYKLKSTVIDPESYPLHGNRRKSLGGQEVEKQSQRGKGAHARQTSQVFRYLKKSCLF